MRFRAWVIAGPSKVELKEFDTEVGGGLVALDSPEYAEAPSTPLRDDQVILRTLTSSVCDTDKLLYPMGGDTRRPLGCQFGHEMVSRIVAKGSAVKDLEVGDRVYPFPRLVKDSVVFAGRPGAFSELVVCDHAEKGRNLYPVDERISNQWAAMIEPFTIGHHTAVISEPKPGNAAVIIGANTLGLATAVCLREMGVEDIVIVNWSCERLDLVRGIDGKKPFETVTVRDKDWLEQIEARFGTTQTPFGPAIDVDIWVDASSNSTIFESVFAKAKNFARLTSIAAHHRPAQIDLTKLAYSSVTLRGAGGYLPEDVQPVLDIMGSGRYKLDSMISATFPFSHFDEAMEYCQINPNCFKCQIDFGVDD